MPITKQTIAIIGSSSIMGTAIAKGLCSENYKLLLFDKDDTKSDHLIDELCSEVENADVEVIECQHMASWEADIIVITNDYNDLREVSIKIRDVSTQKIIVVILRNNGLDQLEWVESYFPHSKVVGIIPSDVTSDSVQLMTKHPRALNIVKEMAEQAGFDPILKELTTC